LTLHAVADLLRMRISPGTALDGYAD
jgi:hypothetical protein